MDISRRSFLKGTVAAGALTAAGVSLPAVGGLLCAKAEAESAVRDAQSQPVTGAGSALHFADNDHTYGALLNPQADFSANSGDFSPLFQPLKLGSKVMKNRFGKSAASSEMQYDPDWPDQTSIGFYEEFCKGGVGMVCFEYSNFIPRGGRFNGNTFPEGPGGMHWLDISTDDGIPAHKAVTDVLHKYDTIVLAQMWDLVMSTGGGGTDEGNKALENSFNFVGEQSTEDVQQEIQYFIDGAVRYAKAGFDGVELNASCNHYLSTFLSRMSNHTRTDQYSGATIENRCRVITEIIEGIRRAVGEDFIIQVLYSGVEENLAELGDNRYCITIDEACEMARLFEKAGATSLHIRSQAYGNHSCGFMTDMMHYYEHGDTGYGTVVDFSRHFSGMEDGSHDGAGALLNVAARIKSCVSIPVGTVGCMDARLAPDLITNAVADGKVDFVLMTRPLLADTHFVSKLEAGKHDEIAPCAHCMTCFAAPYDVGIAPMYCRVNAAMSRAFTEDMPEGYDLLPAKEARNVMVIGGGPAGMEAARIAAERGHRVTLYEKAEQLGGMMDIVQKIKGPHERINDHKNYLIRQLDVKGVTVHTGVEVTADFVREQAPDAVVVAVGGRYNVLDVPNAQPERVLTVADMGSVVDSGVLPVGDRVVIVGGQFQATSIAVNLARAGKQVTLLNPGEDSAYFMNVPTWPRMMGKPWLAAKGVKVYHNALVQEITADGLVAEVDNGMTLTFPFDHVIQMLTMLPDRELFDSLSGVCDEVYAVGSCYSPNTIANAVARANLVARRIGEGSTQSAADLAENQYSAAAAGIGDVRVTITVDDGKIVDAVVDTSNETAGIGRELGERFAAQILEKGEIDSVSGATVTTEAARSALHDCLVQAGLR